MKEILSFLSIQDLCKCSLVSKYWNFHAREVLRDVKHCLACIEEENSCRDLKRLNTVLENSTDIVPFCGLAISCPWSYYNHKCVKYKDLNEFTESLLNKVKIRFLAIDCERKLNCASVHSIKRIFQETCTHLEALSVEKLPLFVLSLSEFLGYRAPLETLYNMKELDFPCDYDEDGLPESVIKELVTAAPNLKRLTGNITPRCLEFILPLGKVAAVKDFNLEATEANLPMCLKFAKEQPKLEKLRFSSAFEDDDDAPIIFNWSEYSILKLAEVLVLLLESSKDTLTDLAVDHLDLILLIRFGLPVLNKLKRLTLTFSESVDRHEGYCTLRRINFEKYFPKLQWVQIRFSYFQNEGFYIKDEFRENTQEYICSTVNTLVFSPILRNVNVSQVGRFAELFPAVKNFYIHRCDKLATFLGALWTSWPELETMTFLTVEDRVAKNNLDPVFCGITKKEANTLKDFEGDLDKFQLVPVRPSIRNLKSKQFKTNNKMFRPVEL